MNGDSKQSIYRYVGEEPEPLEVDFNTLVSKNSKVLAQQKQTTSEIAASISNINESESTNTSFLKASANASKVDAIDILLQNPKDRSKRVYRGFYFDDDVLSIIDRVPKSYKSELVNEALRKVFKEKAGLSLLFSLKGTYMVKKCVLSYVKVLHVYFEIVEQLPPWMLFLISLGYSFFGS
ncbi:MULTISPECIES: hypothetical protein [Priestia]|uniref:hypothetical protein n=1 Tax=Priestia TaxID=2800373 RepID=UPI0027E334ED|nr:MULTISPECIES: hypothetical protein [Priestia]